MKFPTRLVVAVACLISLRSLPVCAADAVEGTYKLVLMNDDASKEYQDTVVIKGETLTSTRLAREGFGAIPCETTSRIGGVGNFSAQGKSSKGGKAKWSGNVLANTVTGTLELTAPDGTTTNFSIKGERVAK